MIFTTDLTREQWDEIIKAKPKRNVTPDVTRMSDWQPIESAPKGELIVGQDGKRGYISVGIFLTSDFEVVDFKCMGTGTGFYPTHWMPLPKPPSEPK